MGTGIRSGVELLAGAALGVVFGGSMIGSPATLALAIGAVAALLLGAKSARNSSD